jgi:hypothetical protein
MGLELTHAMDIMHCNADDFNDQLHDDTLAIPCLAHLFIMYESMYKCNISNTTTLSATTKEIQCVPFSSCMLQTLNTNKKNKK